MTEPLFWLGLSLTLVSISLTAVLVVALPALQELARAARSAEKLFDSLNREFPPTLEAIRLTGLEISELTDDLNQGVRTVEDVVQTVDRGVTITKEGAKKVQGGSKRFVAGVKAAWHSWQVYPTEHLTVESKGKNGKK
ncbi:sll0269 [Synechocystis sp. PCC 6803]|uniref:Sll0269 protein n=1 Tax=Synechocystis sp. (strain ATCC 27184 / PCC 6803 / Kazusa) TaxID=1111708 RepID=P74398_SYNY3|nr:MULTISPECIES: hypothetical protein [unclassified Synechocystis]BAM54780.1 hypothetical protein BEST7613_5849 [Synechocystis sp. PCC 6803] [Bacillus subtilis BEST7613]AGF52184.1 hypothetical protein MYO_119420 [Synechocystis sp. PCC 6803]ALJ68133.1 hypothetical protein AOY38_09995 [Synechocystis sp. PCC 6803]AVP89975.1 hypothetical protein C7I86_10035 [Synechocystis sp. IPPAS B-1465]MBD2617772.1 DUF948 domain-containing protein [Synechocystis sp. FACHB-898]